MTATALEPIEFKAEIRTELGKEWAKKVRKEGLIPAVIYGSKTEPVSLILNEHDLKMSLQAARGDRRLINLELSDGTIAKAFFKDFQRDPVTDRIIHVDFFRVLEDQEVDINVPVRHHGGTPAGIKLGGLLEQIRHEVVVKAKPDDIPPYISVDLTDLTLAQTIHISELPVPDGVSVVGKPTDPIFTIAAKGKDAKEALREMIAAERAEEKAKADAEAEEDDE